MSYFYLLYFYTLVFFIACLLLDSSIVLFIIITVILTLPPSLGSYSLNFFFFLGLHLWQMDVPRLQVESELQLPAYATTTATSDPWCICNLHHSSRQCRILKLLSKARDQTSYLMVPSQICFHCATKGTPPQFLLYYYLPSSLSSLPCVTDY